MFKIFTYVFRLVLLLCAAFVFYTLIPFKIAEIKERWAMESASGDTAYLQVLHWNPNRTVTLTNLAEMAQSQNQPDQAITYALQALSVDPTNGRASALLITLYEQTTADDKATNREFLQQALSLAPKQWSAHSYIHTILADYWARQGDFNKVLSEWDLLLTRHRVLYKPIFPVLLSYAKIPEGQGLLTPFASRPARWWQDFFIYMVNQKVDLPTLQYFYQQRVNSGVPLEEKERLAYVRRLEQAKLWDLAYSTWVSGLSGKEFALIGTLYDGGFESARHNTGFDWFFRQSKQARITLGRTHGIEGKRALHIVFKGRKAIAFRQVWQRLLLEPGRNYQVSMKARVDNLENPQGLVWRLACADQSSQALATSPAIKGNKKWHTVHFDVTVPEQGCTSQIIRLESASKYHHEQFYKGAVWFDDLHFSPLEQGDNTNAVTDD